MSRAVFAGNTVQRHRAAPGPGDLAGGCWPCSGPVGCWHTGMTGAAQVQGGAQHSLTAQPLTAAHQPSSSKDPRGDTDQQLGGKSTTLGWMLAQMSWSVYSVSSWKTPPYSQGVCSAGPGTQHITPSEAAGRQMLGSLVRQQLTPCRTAALSLDVGTRRGNVSDPPARCPVPNGDACFWSLQL